MVDLLDVPDGYDYHAPAIDVPARVVWLNRLFRLVLALLVLAVAWLIHGRPPLTVVALGIATIHEHNPALYILIVISSLGIFPIHELIHAVAGYLRKLRVRIGWDWTYLAPFVTTYGRPQTRSETALVAGLPFATLTPLLVLIIVFASTPWAAVFTPPALINILGSGPDLNTLWRMHSLPDGALLQNDRDENTAYYVPSH